MPQGPTIEHDGRTYERSRGEWLDTVKHCAVARSLTQKLDGLARKDAALWQRCLAQDARDRPAHSGPRSLTGHGLAAAYFADGRRLRLTLDIEAGWRQTEKTWKFGARQVVDLLEAGSLGCAAEVLEDGVHLEQPDAEAFWPNKAELAAVPSFPEHESTEDEVVFHVAGRKAVFEIPIFSPGELRQLNPRLEWSCVNDRWEFTHNRGKLHEVMRTVQGHGMSRSYCFRLRCVLLNPLR